MRPSTVFATAAAAVLLAGPALAGGVAPVVIEPDPVAYEPVPVATGGDWSGASAGVSLGWGDISGGGDGDGMLYGLRGAYNWDFGGWVVGATASYDWADIDLGGAGNALNGIGRVGLRGGVDLGQTFVYATGGAAWADADIGAATGTERGWFGGIGAERRIGESWTVGGEILTNRFEDVNGTAVDLDATTVGLNVGMRF